MSIFFYWKESSEFVEMDQENGNHFFCVALNFTQGKKLF